MELKSEKLETNLYCRETDKHLNLQKDSDHPKCTKASLPYGLGLILKRISSEDSSYETQMTVLRSKLNRRGCKEGIINRVLRKVYKVERKEALRRTDRSKVISLIGYFLFEPFTRYYNIEKSNMHMLHVSQGEESFQEIVTAGKFTL